MTFKDYLQQKDLIPQTLNRYLREINKYISFIESKGISIYAIEKKHLLSYLKYVREQRNASNGVIYKVFTIIRHYHAFLNLSYGCFDITFSIKIRGAHPKRLRYLFNEEQLQQLCEDYLHYVRLFKPTKNHLAYDADYKGLLQRRYIAFSLVVYQGLKPKEIIKLEKQDFDFTKGTVRIKSALKSAGRTLPLNVSQIGVLLQHFSTETTIITNHLKQFEYINSTLKSLHPKFESVTQIRASVIGNWIKQHGLRKAQYLAGHRKILNTEEYLENDFEGLKNQLDAFHPLG
ncbi:phage integrase N-terminal SAM-like domain-containing protein [Winogradskyella haliclonae]|uniref:Core-binding (CB) domain-containing protein n=1 Tax=Winogradskyella haliclonae TaxID=2048558 RepID=A0ABQ2C333_9FLAO|nr:phage integrase N-terminal SAM-like domain-containing protein [Winogradskyella haliclonae]GGI58483.1 hypothetical protein GCM10011444_27920 [Winogradskyella haliclonae]